MFILLFRYLSLSLILVSYQYVHSYIINTLELQKRQNCN